MTLHTPHTHALHTTRKSRISDALKQRIVEKVAMGAWGVARPMPVVFEGRIIAWVGWSAKENAVFALEHKPWMDRHIDDFGILFGFPTVDALITDITSSGKSKLYFWNKWPFTTQPPTLSWAHWYMVDGFPSAGVFNGTAYTARQHSDNESGAIQHGGNVSPDTKHVLSGTIHQMSTTATDVSVWCLYDMVISYDQCTLSSTPTSFDNTLTAQRYVGSGKPGLQIMGCQHTGMNATGYTALTYTDAAGTTGQAVPNIAQIVQLFNGNTPGAGVPAQSCFSYVSSRGMLTVPLAAGDGGVQKLESITMTATTTDAHDYILGFPLCFFVVMAGNEYTYPHCFVKQAPSVARVYDGACLTFASLIVGNGQIFNGSLMFGWGS